MIWLVLKKNKIYTHKLPLLGRLSSFWKEKNTQQIKKFPILNFLFKNSVNVAEVECEHYI